MLEPTLHVAGVSVRAIEGALPARLERRFADDAWGIDEELGRSRIGEGYAFHVGLDEVLLDVQVEGVRVLELPMAGIANMHWLLADCALSLSTDREVSMYEPLEGGEASGGT